MPRQILIQIATGVILVGTLIVAVASWKLSKKRKKKSFSGGVFGEDDEIAAILETDGLTAEEKTKLRRHLAEKFQEETENAKQNLKKPIDLNEILEEEMKRTRKRGSGE